MSYVHLTLLSYSMKEWVAVHHAIAMGVVGCGGHVLDAYRRMNVEDRGELGASRDSGRHTKTYNPAGQEVVVAPGSL